MKHWHWQRWLGIALLVVGIGILAYNFRSGVDVYNNQKDVAITNYTNDQIKQNQVAAAKETYEDNEVKTATPEEVAASRKRIKNGVDHLNVLGAVYLPEQQASVSILAGLSQSSLLSGAGTFYADQEIGVGNYPLASHNMSIVGPHLLLTDIIDNTNIGDPVYLTDLDNVYEYETYFAERVDPSRIDLVAKDRTSDDGKPIVTLQTCTDDGTQRYIVQAKLVKKVPYEKADKDIIKGFEEA